MHECGIDGSAGGRRDVQCQQRHRGHGHDDRHGGVLGENGISGRKLCGYEPAAELGDRHTDRQYHHSGGRGGGGVFRCAQHAYERGRQIPGCDHCIHDGRHEVYGKGDHRGGGGGGRAARRVPGRRESDAEYDG